MRKNLSFLPIAVLSALFTVAFFFSMLESLSIANEFLLNFFPDISLANGVRIQERTDFLRPVGYFAFGLTLILVLIGFVVRKGYLSAIGSIAFCLPVFGYFSFTMFFLVGIGAIRALWFPLIDFSPNLTLWLDMIVYLPMLAFPYYIGVYSGWYFHVHILLYGGVGISMFISAAGTFIFFLGTLTWLHGKFKGRPIVDFWIYRFSRHPQYLGFLLWGYGMLAIFPWSSYIISPDGRITPIPPPSFPWLVSTLTIIAVALHEEIEMVRKHGDKYLDYRSRTPFMLPLPKFISALITVPMEFFLKKKLPENRRELAYTLLVYTSILLTYFILYIFIVFVIYRKTIFRLLWRERPPTNTS